MKVGFFGIAEKLILDLPKFKVIKSCEIFVIAELFGDKDFLWKKSGFTFNEIQLERKIEFQILFFGFG